MKKKLLTLLLIVVMLFNFICVNIVYAEPDDSTSTSTKKMTGSGSVTNEQIEELSENGRSTDTEFTHQSTGFSFLGFAMQIVAVVLDSFPILAQTIMGAIAKNPTTSQLDITIWSSGPISFVIDLLKRENFFTIERAIFNEVALFNIDIFNMKSSYTLGIGSNTEDIYQAGANLSLKESTAKWFYICRLFAMMINLCVLIYVGIKMAISTVASEEARYKKMLINWAQSLIILFLLQYIMSFIIQIGESILNVIYVIRSGMDVKSFEFEVMSTVYMKVLGTAGMQVFLHSVFFWFLTGIQLKFFLEYLRRTLSVMFLTIIAPFITVTYPIDKMGDNKAQAFEAWLKQYIINVIIQPIHAAIYLVFVYSANNIAETAPLIAMVFLLMLGKVENIVRNILGVTDSLTVKNVNQQDFRGKGK